MAAPINCPVEKCARTFNNVEDLVEHAIARHGNTPAPAPAAPKLSRPTVEAGATPAAWTDFTVQLDKYLA